MAAAFPDTFGDITVSSRHVLPQFTTPKAMKLKGETRPLSTIVWPGVSMSPAAHPNSCEEDGYQGQSRAWKQTNHYVIPTAAPNPPPHFR